MTDARIFKDLSKIKTAYEGGKNVIQLLKESYGFKRNTDSMIQISYDLQAGSYIRAAAQNPNHLDKYTGELASVFRNLGDFRSLVEVGVGEATTLCNLLTKIDNSGSLDVYGFDIAWSRLSYAELYRKQKGLNPISFLMAHLFETPFKDNSIDVVYTSHSIEPNGGREIEALQELYRITRKYLVLLEPSWEFANEAARERMAYHGYVKNLYSAVKQLNYNVIEHRLFGASVNPLNPTGLIIIAKKPEEEVAEPLACPLTKTSLVKMNNCYYSRESMLAYPIIGDIPCLLSKHGIIATHFKEAEQ